MQEESAHLEQETERLRAEAIAREEELASLQRELEASEAERNDAERRLAAGGREYDAYLISGNRPIPGLPLPEWYLRQVVYLSVSFKGWAGYEL